MSILNPLFDAVAWVMMQIHAGLSHLFGPSSGVTWCLTIVLLVVLMRLIMVPLFIKQRNSMQKMQAHNPQLQELRKRFKHDKQRLNEETMKFYKENGINPLGGCLPMVAQMPVFWALFEVLEYIARWTPGQPTKYGLTEVVVRSALNAKVFGVSLADNFLRPIAHESMTSRIIIFCFVLISAGTTFLTMRQSKKRGMLNQGPPPDPDQPGAAMAQTMSKNMMYIAPFFALTGLYWQFGLVIYWVTTNVWTLGQQHFLFRNLPVVGSATVDASATQAVSGASAGAKRVVGAAGRTGSASVKSGGAAKPGGAAKSGVTSKPGAAKSSSGTKSGAVPASNGGKPAGSARPASKSGASGTSRSPSASANGAAANGSGNGSGLLRRFGKKDEPQEVPAAPQAKVVRQQPVRQTRSRRGNTGKR
ncbi:MAG: membrane protein insertase YidC [Trebonia sp.]